MSIECIVGKKFPSIVVKSIDKSGEVKKINLRKLAVEEEKKVLLFWYPKDFTFVCPTEIHAFQDALSEFEKRNTLVVGASCDTAEVHFAWLNTPKNKGGIEGVTFPLISDSTRILSSKLGILDGDPDDLYEFYEYEHTDDLDEEDEVEVEVEEETLELFDHVTYRATYLIDESGVVFHESINHMPLGRNVAEFLRLVDAYTHVQKHGEVCPANWQSGEEAITADINSTAQYLSKH